MIPLNTLSTMALWSKCHNTTKIHTTHFKYTSSDQWHSVMSCNWVMFFFLHYYHYYFRHFYYRQESIFGLANGFCGFENCAHDGRESIRFWVLAQFNVIYWHQIWMGYCSVAPVAGLLLFAIILYISVYGSFFVYVIHSVVQNAFRFACLAVSMAQWRLMGRNNNKKWKNTPNARHRIRLAASVVHRTEALSRWHSNGRHWEQNWPEVEMAQLITMWRETETETKTEWERNLKKEWKKWPGIACQKRNNDLFSD